VSIAASPTRHRGPVESHDLRNRSRTPAAGGLDTDATHASDDSLVVMDAVRGLPPRQRETVILRYYEDLPEAEIAKILSCSVGTVKSQLAKARASLSAALGSMSLERDEP
jgi:RNA polymerase sigma factor (sigma-70 family)